MNIRTFIRYCTCVFVLYGIMQYKSRVCDVICNGIYFFSLGSECFVWYSRDLRFEYLWPDSQTSSRKENCRCQCPSHTEHADLVGDGIKLAGFMWFFCLFSLHFVFSKNSQLLFRLLRRSEMDYWSDCPYCFWVAPCYCLQGGGLWVQGLQPSLK